LSRFRSFVLIAALALSAAFVAACGGGGDGGGEDPQKVLDGATLRGIESGKVDLALDVNSEGKDGGELKVSLAGPFQAKGGPEALPELAIELTAKGNAGDDKIDFDGGLTLLSDRAFVQYEGQAYEVDPTTFGFVRSALERAQSEGGAEAADVAACRKAAEQFDVGSFLSDPVNEGEADVEGASTTKVSGKLNVGGAIDALIKLTKDPACSKQLKAAGPLPIGELEDAKRELREAVRDGKVDVYVGDDDIVRKLSAEATIQPEKSGEKVELTIDLTLSGVNEDQSIERPEGAKPLEALFRQLDVNPLELFQAGTSEGIGGLLEGLDGDDGSGSGSGGGGDDSAYRKCLERAKTSADLQRCARKR